MKKTFMLPTMSFMTRLLEKSSTTGLYIVSSLISLIIISAIFSSCAKDPGQIGYVIQPEDSKLNVAFTDTSSIYAYSVLMDSIRTDRLTVNALGSLRDPVFGSTTAGFYTQFIMSVPGKVFGESAVLDSLVLQMHYGGYYGDTNSTLTVHTYEMLEGLSGDSVYYSNFQGPIGSNDYSNYSFVPQISDSLMIDSLILPPALRINLTDLNPELGQKLISATEEEMEDDETFQAFFPGLFVQSEPIYEDGCIVYLGLTSKYSMLSLYYHDDTDTTNQKLRYDYIVATSTATVNKYEHNYNTASPDFKAQLIDGDTTLGRQKYYVQGYGGVQSKVKFPHIRKWALKENVAINEAKLVLPGIDNDEFFGAPAQLSLVSIGDDGVGVPLIDQAEGELYFDGVYNSSANKYEFRITRYIQSLISDTTISNNGLYLFVYGGSVRAERYIFEGNELTTDSTGIKLEILFTDL